MTLTKISPVMSMPVMTFFPSVAASSTATSHCSATSIGATLPQSSAVSRKRGVHGAVARDRFRAHVRAQCDQLGEIVDRLDGAAFLDAHQSVRVEVVAEQQRRVAVLGREEP